jgi:hypothetical protein
MQRQDTRSTSKPANVQKGTRPFRNRGISQFQRDPRRQPLPGVLATEQRHTRRGPTSSFFCNSRPHTIAFLLQACLSSVPSCMSSKKNKNGESKNYKVVVIGPGGVVGPRFFFFADSSNPSWIASHLINVGKKCFNRAAGAREVFGLLRSHYRCVIVLFFISLVACPFPPPPEERIFPE